MRTNVPFTRIKAVRCLILAVCAFAAACSGERPGLPTSPTSAAAGLGQTQTQGGQHLPFDGSLQALETDVVDPPHLHVVGTATGTGNHLGRFTATFTATVALATGSATGNISFTAANGDRLDAAFVGQGNPTNEPNFASIEEVATIQGGTGRFAKASGAFTIRRVLNQISGESSGAFEGFINLEH